MGTYMRVNDVRYMTYEELQRWWEVDFSVLVTTAVAEATGEVHQSVREALASSDWIESWADALFAGCGELLSSVERMTFTRDHRLGRTKKTCGLMMNRVGEVNRILKQEIGKQGWEMAPASMKSGYRAALSILGGHYREELHELYLKECIDRGIPERNPLWGLKPGNGLDALEDATRRGVIAAPITSDVRDMLAFTEGEVELAVGADANTPDERRDALRHPLMLRRWSVALESLLEKTCRLNDMPPEFTLTLPKVNMGKLWEMPREEGMRVINRRRFLRVLVQRNRECEMHKRQLIREVSFREEGIKRPWNEAAQAAREALGVLHSEELNALVEAFRPHCEPNSKEMLFGAITRGQRTGIVCGLKKKLADGTLLNAPSEGRGTA